MSSDASSGAEGRRLAPAGVGQEGVPAPRHPFALRDFAAAVLVLVVVLAVLAPWYGYHRDELYFRMLPLDWGYTDQPPLTPLLAHAAVHLLGDSVVALRVVPLLCAAGSLFLLALITREVGGDRRAQRFTAWAMAGATLTLLFGHVLLTASLDLVVWPAALLFAFRAVLRMDGRWWVAAGAVIGASTLNKVLVVVLMAGIAAGLAVVGPRRWFACRWMWAGVALAGVLAIPTVVYQIAHGWPQLAMGAALSQHNGAQVRILMWPMLVLLVGPVLAAVWILGLVGLFRRPGWRQLRWFGVTVAVVVAFVFIGGTQYYYTAGVLATLVAIGAVPVTAWARTRGRRWLVAGLLVVNAVGCALTSLPLLPMQVFGATGLAAINTAAGDQVGWETYAAQVSAASAATHADAVIASNYGEAGALNRFGRDLPPVVSGHNALGDDGGPPAGADTVVIVGSQGRRVANLFASCTQIATLDNRVGVKNEEQGQPITACRGPVAPWDRLWDRFRHLS
ncbi:glycosyltransferase family 39 protein [Tersicoccus sp. MR15.9]|uniref:ArnT family glycosyltransferase n=1 Tax=Tersicoccus mangrovi TaxID=3121635 RepID=UPI002FE5F79A